MRIDLKGVCKCTNKRETVRGHFLSAAHLMEFLQSCIDLIDPATGLAECNIPLFVCSSVPVELKEHLQSFVDETNTQHGPGFVKVVRHDKQEGLIRSRVSGWRAATAPVVALFDAHVEFNTGW